MVMGNLGRSGLVRHLAQVLVAVALLIGLLLHVNASALGQQETKLPSNAAAADDVAVNGGRQLAGAAEDRGKLPGVFSAHVQVEAAHNPSFSDIGAMGGDDGTFGGLSGKRGRRLMEDAIDMKEIDASASFTAYLQDNLGYMNRLMYVGVLDRDAVVAACRQLVGGKGSGFTVDVNTLLPSTVGDVGDDLRKVAVKHQYGCTVKKEAEMKLSTRVEEGEVFGRVRVKGGKATYLVDCREGESSCHMLVLLPRAAAGGVPGSEIEVSDEGGHYTIASPLMDAACGAKGPPGPKSGRKPDRKSKRKSKRKSDSDKYSSDKSRAHSRRSASAALAAIKSEDCDYELGCFPADALVRVEGGGTVPMHQLKLGDRVLAVMPNGELGYDQVYLFGHKDPRALAAFVVITTAANSTLRATPDHFMHVVPAAKAASSVPPSWSDMVHMPAQHVKAGDYLFNVELGYAVKVTQVQQQVAKGLYNPYTMSGNIVVDGYSASTHSNMPTLAPLVKLGLHAPSLYQAALAPVRAVHRLHPGLLGYVDDMYSENGWLDVGVLDVLQAIAHYQSLVISA